MSTPGLTNMVVGGLVAVGGLAVTVITAAGASGGGRYVIAWGAILFGLIQCVRGGMTFSKYNEMAPADQILDQVAEPARTLIAALAGAVRNPEAPSAAEIAAINRELRQAMQKTIQESMLLDAARAMGRQPDGAAGYLKIKNASLDPQVRMIIMRSCCKVMIAEPTRDDAQEKLVAIGQALDMTEPQVRGVVGELAKDLDGKSLEITLKLTPDEARDGKRVAFTYASMIACPPCAGAGCKACGDTGRVRGDRTLTIDVPPGQQDGGKLKCTGEGEREARGGTRGDLYIKLAVAAQPA